jgi:hypothetical protein
LELAVQALMTKQQQEQQQEEQQHCGNKAKVDFLFRLWIIADFS